MRIVAVCFRIGGGFDDSANTRFAVGAFGAASVGRTKLELAVRVRYFYVIAASCKRAFCFGFLGFFTPRNRRFAAAFLRPHEQATLSINVPAGYTPSIALRSWETTRGLQLKVCCDTTQTCVYHSELGVAYGTRHWLPTNANCPKYTKRVSKTVVRSKRMQSIIAAFRL